MEEEETYVCRKGYHSINVQAVVDSAGIFRNIVVRWPGSTHDAFIWGTSGVRQRFVEGDFGDGWLLGDSGYPLRPFLLTPVRVPQDQSEERYIYYI